jgi:FkbM family methyltransferase
MTTDVLAYKLWNGRCRRWFRALAFRLLHSRDQIILGPLKGYRIPSPDLQCVLGIYEIHIQLTIVDNLKPGETFYDIGANRGFLGLLAANRVGPDGHIYEFEPLQENVAYIQSLMRMNRVHNFTVVPSAVSDVSGKSKFYLGNSHSTASLSCGSRHDSVVVETITLDQFVFENRWPALIKMDIEGGELAALEGATKIMASKRPPTWIIEVHDRELDQEVSRLLISNGYTVSDLPAPSPRRKVYPKQILARHNQAA